MYILLINNLEYCGDDSELGEGERIEFNNKKEVEKCIKIIKESWTLQNNTIFNIVKV
jgi:hypothetical protein